MGDKTINPILEKASGLSPEPVLGPAHTRFRPRMSVFNSPKMEQRIGEILHH